MRRAASLFTILPVGSFLDLTRPDARRAIAWLPWLGLALGVASGVAAGWVAWWRPGLGLLAATVGVGLWVLATGAMHLDGLADTCDGLGSRRPAEGALAVMKQSDIGPMGVAALVFVVLLEVVAAGSLTDPLALGVALALAPMVGRSAALWATLEGVAAARASGFGALFAGVTSRASALVGSGAVLAVCAGAGWALDAFGALPGGAVRGVGVLPVGALIALGGAAAWGRALVRRFGGITGDLIGAQIEGAQAAFLVLAAIGLGAGG